jgi:hypothetical protein
LKTRGELVTQLDQAERIEPAYIALLANVQIAIQAVEAVDAERRIFYPATFGGGRD